MCVDGGSRRILYEIRLQKHAFSVNRWSHQLEALLDDLWCPFVAVTAENCDMGKSRPAVRDVRRFRLTDDQSGRRRQRRPTQ